MRYAILIASVLGFLALPHPGTAGELRARIEKISVSKRADGDGYVLRLHTSGNVSAFSEPAADGPNRVRIILFQTDISPSRDFDAPAGPIRSYRVDEWNGNVVLRVDFAIQGVVPTIYRDRGTTDVLVNISTSDAGPPVPRLETARTASSKQAGDRWQIDTIVIDAGHGGHDTGAVSRSGIREKDVALSVALQLGKFLREKLRVSVVFTRTTDEFITLRNRGKIANDAGGKLFVSIHANSAKTRRARGTETFFLGLHRSDSARVVMERENRVISLESDPSQYASYDGTDAIQQALARSAYLQHSERLAALIEEQFRERVHRSSRGVKQAGFYVLYGASMPAVLVELGFVTNPGEAHYLASKDGQSYMASAIFRAIRSFKFEYEKALQMAAG